MFSTAKTLIVICKDEILTNQLRKLVETDDDIDDRIVGTKDDSVKIVAWTEKVWLDQKKAGNIDSKVLFIDDIKDTDKLRPVLDIKFDDCGVKYGWAGNQAAIFSDTDALKDEETYNTFMEKLNALPVPDVIKNKKAASVGAKKRIGLTGIGLLLGPVGAVGVNLLASMYADKKAVKHQMFFYGILNLYNNHLEEFMQQ